jgi:hypothetical protein
MCPRSPRGARIERSVEGGDGPDASAAVWGAAIATQAGDKAS